MKVEKTPEPEPKPGVMVGDEVFFRHPHGDRSGRVDATGKHGCTIHCAGSHHRVKWEHVLGHKRRAQQHYNVIEQGEDGHLVEDAAGIRRYIHVPNESREDPLVAKADKPGGSFSGRPGLTQKQITDRTGRRQTKWVRVDKDQPKERKRKVDEPPEAGSRSGYGTHNLQGGDKVRFKLGDLEGAGAIVGKPGRDGAHVKDASGRVHQVLWTEITSHDTNGTKKLAVETSVRGEQKPVHPAKFRAAEYAKSHDDEGVNPESIISGFPPDTSEKIRDVQERLAAIEQTIDTHKRGDNYLPERQAKHREIYTHFLSPERIEAATPADGEQPTFTVLGGRGGSGKSWFKNKVYDPNRAIVLDADEIKGMLPEYEGWNAAQVHEESSEILKSIILMARNMGLNVVLDGTMASKSVLGRIKEFKQAGYRIEAHYMHLPRQEAAKRAVARFLGKTNRYVPVDVVLANKDNESVFDEVRKHVDAWSFRDNNVAEGQEPILISEGKRGQDDLKLLKSEQERTILLWKVS